MPKRIGFVTLPVFEIGDREFTSLRQQMLSAGPHGVSTGGGLGSSAVYAELETDGKMVYRYILGQDVLTATAELVHHPDAGRIPHSDEYKPQPHSQPYKKKRKRAR